MDNIVSKIIFNELSSRKPISLPHFGSLWVEYVSAKTGNGEVTPPNNVVSFSPELKEGAHSIIERIEAVGIDRETAENMYMEWLEESRTPEGITIKDAGEVKNGEFTPFPELAELLNPDSKRIAGHGSKKLSKAEKNWLLLIIIFILILIVGWGWWISAGRYKNDERVRPKSKTTVSTSRTVSSTTSSGKTINAQASTSVEAEQTNEATTEQAAAEQPQTTQGQGTVAITPSANGYYVVGGVFSTQENADKFIREMKADYASFDYRKHDFKGGKIMVSLAGPFDNNEAQNKRKELANNTGIHDLWIYKVQ